MVEAGNSLEACASVVDAGGSSVEAGASVVVDVGNSDETGASAVLMASVSAAGVGTRDTGLEEGNPDTGGHPPNARLSLTPNLFNVLSLTLQPPCSIIALAA